MNVHVLNPHSSEIRAKKPGVVYTGQKEACRKFSAGNSF